jgi:hypothetical protein
MVRLVCGALSSGRMGEAIALDRNQTTICGGSKKPPLGENQWTR